MSMAPHQNIVVVPIQYSVLNGDKETGITIMKYMKMDAGDIFSQKLYQLKLTIPVVLYLIS